jgi:hypothetical protein
MAVCGACNKEMTDGVSCVSVPFTLDDGQEHEPVPYDGPEKCHDCSTPAGGFHHPGCDMEGCPKCGGQLISCGCIADE